MTEVSQIFEMLKFGSMYLQFSKIFFSDVIK